MESFKLRKADLLLLAAALVFGAVLAAVLPFAVIFLPALMLGDINTLLSNILGLLPDKLLQINRDLAYFDLYQLGDSVMGAIPILLVLYTVPTLLFIPLLYKTYQHKQLK